MFVFEWRGDDSLSGQSAGKIIDCNGERAEKYVDGGGGDNERREKNIVWGVVDSEKRIKHYGYG